MKIFVALEMIGVFGLLACKSMAEIISENYTALIPVDGDWISSSDVEATVMSLAPKDNGSRRYTSLKDGVRSSKFQYFPWTKSFSRDLAEGDLDELFELIQNFEFRLPDFESMNTNFFIDAKLVIKNILCREVFLDDMIIDHNLENNQNLKFNIDLKNLDLTCEMDFKWGFGIASGEGSVMVRTRIRSASTELSFSSENFDFYPPNSSVMETCETDLKILELDITGSVSAKLMDWFADIIPRTIENEIADITCEEFTSLSTTLVGDMVNLAREKVDQYSLPSEQWISAANEVEVVNFKNTEEMGKVLQDLISESNSFFGSWFDSEEGFSTKDLGINIFLRDNILDEDKALELAIGDMPFPVDPMLFEGHDKITQTQIILNKIRILGLDQFTKFEAAEVITNSAYQHHLNWGFLKVELDLTVHIKPSTMDDSILYAPEFNMGISEHITVQFRLYNIDATVAFLLAVDQDILEEISLGSLLSSKNIIPCFFSTLLDLDVSGLDVSVENIGDLKLTGFVSQGVDSIVTESVEAAFSMYENVIIQRIPSIFQTTIRNLANDFLKTKLSESHCPSVKIVDEVVDFRDLFLTANRSMSLGGFGDERYGDIIGYALEFLRDHADSTDEGGLLQLNSAVIRPLTKAQSGVEGMLQYEESFFSIVEDNIPFELLERFEFGLSNATIQNLDIALNPIDTNILQPKDRPYSLTNRLHLGPVAGRPLTVTLTMDLDYVSKGSPYPTQNEMEISITMDSFKLLADTFAMIGSSNLLNFPLKDLMNVQCWLATILVDTNKLAALGNSSRFGVSLESFVSNISDLSIDMQCRECTNKGLSIVKELMEILDKTQTTNMLGRRLSNLVEEMMLSDAAQNMMNRILLDSPKSCPHYPNSESIEVKDYQFEEQYLAVSTEVLDTLLFATAALLQVGFVLLTEAGQYLSVDPSNPLSIQNEFDVASGVNILDFTNLDDSLSPAIKFLFEEGRNLLNSENSIQSLDALNSTGTDLNDSIDNAMNIGINTIMDQLIENDGFLTFPFENLQYTNTGIVFQFSSVRIAGLNSFTRLDLLNAISPQTLQNTFNLKQLSIEIDFSINSVQTTDQPQHLTLFLEADDVNATVPVFIAMNIDLFNQLEVGSLLKTNDIISCVLSTITDFQMPQMAITVGKIREPRFQGLLPETESVLSNLTTFLYKSYDDEIKEGVSFIADSVVRPVINNRISSYIAESSCKNILVPDKQPNNDTFSARDKEFIDFRDLLLPETESKKLGGSGKSPYGDLLPRGYTMLQELILEVDPVTGLSKLNDMIIGPLSQTHSGDVGTFSFLGELVDLSTRIDVEEFAGFARLRISDVHIENADSIGSPLSLMDALFQQPYGLNNSVTLGASDIPFRFSLRILFAFSQDDGMELVNDVKITVDLLDAKMLLTMFIQIFEDRFATFPVADLFNFYCWLAMIPAPTLDEFGVRLKELKPSAEITNLAVSLSELKVKVECISCSSPGITELTELWSSPEATSSTNQLMEKLFDTFFSGSSFAQVHIDRILNEAPLQCPHSSTYRANLIDTTYKAFASEGIDDTGLHKVLFQILAAASFLLAFVTGVAFLVAYIVNRRHEKWLESLSKRRIFALKQFQHEKEGKELDLNTMTKSMFQSSAIPAFWRYAIPIVLLGNFAFFLSGHLSIGATVNIEGQVAGENFRVEQFYHFSMVQSTIEIWEAGAKSLALLILIFSGIWPYSKTLITLVLWFLPPTTVSISRRGSILLWLDALAKWSMVDIFALIMSIVAFRMSITSPDTAYLPKDFYSIDVMVVPLWGLYANMIAQLISQLSSHLIIHYHRKIVRNATRRYEAIHEEGSNCGSVLLCSDDYSAIDPNGGTAQKVENQCDSLYNQTFWRPTRGENDKLVTRCYVNYLFCLLAISMVAFLFLGCYYPSFSVEILGLLGVVVESGQHFEEAIKHHNIFSTMKLLADEASFLNNTSHYFGIGTLISICFICVIIVPLVQAVALAYQWFFLMTKKTRAKLSIFLEILQAWQYSEVYIISIIVASWQFGPVSDFMINEYCDGFNEQLYMLDYFGFLDNRDVQCFQLQATIQNSTYFIAASAALLALMNTFVTKATTQYFGYSHNNIAVNLADPPGKKLETTFLDYDEERWNNATQSENSPYIQPPPILFTDTFRWLLQREDRNIASESESYFYDDEEQTLMGGMSNDSDDQEQYSNGHSIISKEKEELTENSESTSLSISLATKIEVLPSYYSDMEDDNDTVQSDNHTAATEEDDGNTSNNINNESEEIEVDNEKSNLKREIGELKSP